MLLNFVRDHCAAVDFVFKGDDDIFVNPIQLLWRIKVNIVEGGAHSFGCLGRQNLPIRWLCKYYVPEELWPNSTEPYKPYYSGAAFVLSNSLVRRITAIKHQFPNFPIDDAYVGYEGSSIHSEFSRRTVRRPLAEFVQAPLFKTKTNYAVILKRALPRISDLSEPAGTCAAKFFEDCITSSN